MPGLIVNRRKRKDDSTLFPGHALQDYIKGLKAGSTMVGMTFEAATERLMGSDRRSTNGTADVCPDVIDEKRELWIESKATQRRSAFKVPIDQLEMYDQAQFDAAMWGKHYQVLYCMWTYTETRITKPRDWSPNGTPDVRIPTKEELIRLVLGSATHIDVIDFSVLRRVRECCESFGTAPEPESCRVRDYASWAGYQDGAPYHVLNVGHRFLERLRSETRSVLEDLGLDPKEYRWKQHRALMSRVVINDMRFPMPDLGAFELVRPEGWVDHEGAEDAAPF